MTKTIKLKRQFICSFIVAFSLLGLPRDGHAQDHPEDILIVTNKTNSVGAITEDELRAIFLKQKTRWSNSQKAVPINAVKGTLLRKSFLDTVMGMDQVKEETYWEKQGIRSGMAPPPEFKTLLKAVFALKGSVSYVFRKDYKKGVVKVLLVLPHKVQ